MTRPMKLDTILSMDDDSKLSEANQSLWARQAVVGVAMRDDQFLIIRRSQLVRAPGKLCMPGGRLEPGESQRAAVLRELREELDVQVEPNRLIWNSISPWGTELFWWSIHLSGTAEIVPNPLEVDSFAWMTAEQMLAAPDLLQSALNFLISFQDGRIRWP